MSHRTKTRFAWRRLHKQQLLACCFSALVCGAAQAAVPASFDCDINGVSVNPANTRGLRGKTGLMRCVERESGVVQREQEVQNGRFTGLVREFEGGQLRKEFSINLRGALHGRAREFASEGQLQLDTLYDNGVIVGVSRRLYPNGQLRRGTAYNAAGDEIAAVEFTPGGKLSNLQCADKPVLAPVIDDLRACGFMGTPSEVDFFSATGTVRARARYLAGKRIGLDTLRDNGRLVLQEEVSATQRIERTFAPDGAKRRELQWNVTGAEPVRERELEFSPTGVLVRERRWIAGELASEMIYFMGGQLRRTAEYLDGGVGTARILAIREYYASGTLASEGSFTNTTRYALTAVGVHRRYDALGMLRSETTYDDRGRPTRERSFDDAGQPMKDDAPVQEDGARRLFSK